VAELTGRARRGLDEVRRRIRTAGGDPDQVRIVAVTKGFGPEAVEAAVEAGCSDIGENYPAELLTKAEAFGAASLHFLGGVQRRQVASIAALVDLWHSVDREEEAKVIASAAPGARVLIQVNLDGPGERADRAGVPPGEVAPLVERLVALPVTVGGLMAVGPRPPHDPREGFEIVARLARELGLADVSMGMSGDLELAVTAGSTMVRVGTALFGPRPPKQAKTGLDAARKVG
jgi:PLP dependent protein